MKRLLCAAAAIAAMSTAAFMPAEAMAHGSFNVVIGTAPPPPRHETMRAPRRGYEWAPGYWNWNGRRHVWIGGHWERVHRGHHYQRAEWQQGHDGWHLNRGGWQPGDRHDEHEGNRYGNGDRDHDGVPNRADRRPDNPRRY